MEEEEEEGGGCFVNDLGLALTAVCICDVRAAVVVGGGGRARPPEEPLADLLLLHVSPAIRLSLVTPRFSSPLTATDTAIFFHTLTHRCLIPPSPVYGSPNLKDPVLIIVNIMALMCARQST